MCVRQIRTNLHVVFNSEEANSATVSFSLLLSSELHNTHLVEVHGQSRDCHTVLRDDYSSFTCQTTDLLRSYLWVFRPYPVLRKAPFTRPCGVQENPVFLSVGEHNPQRMANFDLIESDDGSLSAGSESIDSLEIGDTVGVICHPMGFEKRFSIGPVALYNQKNIKRKISFEEDKCQSCCDVNIMSSTIDNINLVTDRFLLSKNRFYHARSTDGCSGAPVMFFKTRFLPRQTPIVDSSQHSGICSLFDGTELCFSTCFSPALSINTGRYLHAANTGARSVFKYWDKCPQCVRHDVDLGHITKHSSVVGQVSGACECRDCITQTNKDVKFRKTSSPMQYVTKQDSPLKMKKSKVKLLRMSPLNERKKGISDEIVQSSSKQTHDVTVCKALGQTDTYRAKTQRQTHRLMFPGQLTEIREESIEQNRNSIMSDNTVGQNVLNVTSTNKAVTEIPSPVCRHARCCVSINKTECSHITGVDNRCSNSNCRISQLTGKDDEIKKQSMSSVDAPLPSFAETFKLEGCSSLQRYAQLENDTRLHNKEHVMQLRFAYVKFFTCVLTYLIQKYEQPPKVRFNRVTARDSCDKNLAESRCFISDECRISLDALMEIGNPMDAHQCKCICEPLTQKFCVKFYSCFLNFIFSHRRNCAYVYSTQILSMVDDQTSLFLKEHFFNKTHDPVWKTTVCFRCQQPQFFFFLENMSYYASVLKQNSTLRFTFNNEVNGMISSNIIALDNILHLQCCMPMKLILCHSKITDVNSYTQKYYRISQCVRLINSSMDSQNRSRLLLYLRLFTALHQSFNNYCDIDQLKAISEVDNCMSFDWMTEKSRETFHVASDNASSGDNFRCLISKDLTRASYFNKQPNAYYVMNAVKHADEIVEIMSPSLHEALLYKPKTVFFKRNFGLINNISKYHIQAFVSKNQPLHSSLINFVRKNTLTEYCRKRYVFNYFNVTSKINIKYVFIKTWKCVCCFIHLKSLTPQSMLCIHCTKACDWLPCELNLSTNNINCDNLQHVEPTLYCCLRNEEAFSISHLFGIMQYLCHCRYKWSYNVEYLLISNQEGKSQRNIDIQRTDIKVIHCVPTNEEACKSTQMYLDPVDTAWTVDCDIRLYLQNDKHATFTTSNIVLDNGVTNCENQLIAGHKRHKEFKCYHEQKLHVETQHELKYHVNWNFNLAKLSNFRNLFDSQLNYVHPTKNHFTDTVNNCCVFDVPRDIARRLEKVARWICTQDFICPQSQLLTPSDARIFTDQQMNHLAMQLLSL